MLVYQWKEIYKLNTEIDKNNFVFFLLLTNCVYYNNNKQNNFHFIVRRHTYTFAHEEYYSFYSYKLKI